MQDPKIFHTAEVLSMRGRLVRDQVEEKGRSQSWRISKTT